MINRLNCNKSAGPDEVTELPIWLKNDNRQNLLVHCNDILLHGNYPESLNMSNIASICKTGDPATLENYRPIGLLQTFIVGSSRQEPFRTCTGAVGQNPSLASKRKIYENLRLMDMAERQGTNLMFVLSNWEKAIYKGVQDKLIEVISRLCIPQCIICLVQTIYVNTKLRVVKSNTRSNYQTQNSGNTTGMSTITIPVWSSDDSNLSRHQVSF